MGMEEGYYFLKQELYQALCFKTEFGVSPQGGEGWNEEVMNRILQHCGDDLFSVQGRWEAPLQSQLFTTSPGSSTNKPGDYLSIWGQKA